MRILIINESRSLGGAEIQANMECMLLKSKGHEVFLLTFDGNYPIELKGNSLNYPIKTNKLKKMCSRLFGNRKNRREIKNIILSVDPDIIHLHNLITAPIDILKCVGKIPTVQTIHDYGAVCPKSTCIRESKEECGGYLQSNCLCCTKFSLQGLYQYLYIRNYNKLRKKCVDAFIAPSDSLTEKCRNNSIAANRLNNPFDFSKLSDDCKCFRDKKIYLYYGRIVEEKGINELFRAFDDFSVNKNVELWIIGKVEDSFKKRFDILMKARYAAYLGEKSFEDIMCLYKDIYCVIVPSLWIENYPNTVIEAIANKTLVIGTDRGGIPEIIDRKDLCFDILDKSSFVRALEYTYGLSDAEYKSVTDAMNERLLTTNSLDKYYVSLMNLMTNILKNRKTYSDEQAAGL